MVIITYPELPESTGLVNLIAFFVSVVLVVAKITS